MEIQDFASSCEKLLSSCITSGEEPLNASVGNCIDRHNHSKEFLYDTLAILMGGRVAEELVFKHVTSGAGRTTSGPSWS
jgi:hypothetical protein